MGCRGTSRRCSKRLCAFCGGLFQHERTLPRSAPSQGSLPSPPPAVVQLSSPPNARPALAQIQSNARDAPSPVAKADGRGGLRLSRSSGQADDTPQVRRERRAEACYKCICQPGPLTQCHLCQPFSDVHDSQVSRRTLLHEQSKPASLQRVLSLSAKGRWSLLASLASADRQLQRHVVLQEGRGWGGFFKRQASNVAKAARRMGVPSDGTRAQEISAPAIQAPNGPANGERAIQAV